MRFRMEVELVGDATLDEWYVQTTTSTDDPRKPGGVFTGPVESYAEARARAAEVTDALLGVVASSKRFESLRLLHEHGTVQ